MNKMLDITQYEIISKRLPKTFDGCRFLQVSDLHNSNFGEKQKQLIQLSREQNPNYIIVTGDMLDQYHKDIGQAKDCIRGLADIAPVFYVTGNHEWEIQNKERKEFFEFLQQAEISVLHDRIVKLIKGESCIQLMGIDDPYVSLDKIGKIDDRVFACEFLRRLCVLKNQKEDVFTILLSHRPEFIHYYAKADLDLVFCGHAHGGQFRLPILGNILAPHQGFFPKYAEGIIREKNTAMIVSRGLGNSLFPFRIGNNPELVVVTLHTQ